MAAVHVVFAGRPLKNTGSDRTDKTWVGSDRTHKTWIGSNSTKETHIYSLKVGAFQTSIKNGQVVSLDEDAEERSRK